MVDEATNTFKISTTGKYTTSSLGFTNVSYPNVYLCAAKDATVKGNNCEAYTEAAEHRKNQQELMKKYDLAIWAHHGMFAAGEDFDLTFGLMHTVEKSAEILVKMLSIRPDKLQTITPQNFRDLAKDFKVTLPEQFLYEK